MRLAHVPHLWHGGCVGVGVVPRVAEEVTGVVEGATVVDVMVVHTGVVGTSM